LERATRLGEVTHPGRQAGALLEPASGAAFERPLKEGATVQIDGPSLREPYNPYGESKICCELADITPDRAKSRPITIGVGPAVITAASSALVDRDSTRSEAHSSVGFEPCSVDLDSHRELKKVAVEATSEISFFIGSFCMGFFLSKRAT
jgi:hypothetical protein